MILNQRHNLKRLLVFTTGTSIFLITVGVLAIIGWLFSIEVLKSVFPGYNTTMKFNTAVCFILTGAALFFIGEQDKPGFKILLNLLLVVLGVFASVSFFENVFHFSAGIDQLFVNDSNSIAQHRAQPGLMSPSTSMCFVFIAIGLGGILSESLFYRKIAQYLFHTITLIAFVALIGYVFKVPNAMKFSFFSTMAVHTSFAFLLISCVAAAFNPDLAIAGLFSGDAIGNILARKLFQRMIVTLLVVGYINVELQRQNYITAEYGVVVSTILFIVIGLFLISDSLTEMNRLDLKRTQAENETRLLNKNLEEMVLQRTNELKHTNERFVKILNSNPTCIAITRVDNGKYVDVNPALCELIGYKEDEIIGNTSVGLGIITPEFREYMVRALDQHGFMKNEDVVLKGKNGTDKHCLLSAELLENDGEKFLMSFVYDITDRKLMEDNLKENKEELETLAGRLMNKNKKLLSFAHITSHNLRSPVSNLNLLMHFYKESESVQEKEELWGNFETVIGHLNTTLDELLETLKVQEETVIDREKLNFKKTFDSVLEILSGQIRDSDAAIHADFSKATDILYRKIYLESIMLNLVSNAIKYKSPKRAPEIIVCTNDTDGIVTLTVKDNGLGIDLSRHGKDLFGLRKTFHGHEQAKGLGLFITKTQIEAMGGEILVESAEDEGTAFKVIFNKNAV